ncbi:4Fe-4S dicluster domain-containing protein [Ampullimonas aquatilis]|uniref:4Fe-4S dicluster domain-containing protein n=1 Tax=Ampullimonas aquatilis TaxID=1341549 RepID=UPI003C748FED
MNKWNLIIDVARCENCHNCTLALKDEFESNEFPGYSMPQPRHGHQWIRIERKVRGEKIMVDAAYLPSMCNHCDNAPCVAKSNSAINKRDDGIVIIDPIKAKGRKDLIDTCPYGNIWWNEDHQVPQSWFFDAHLLDQGWSEPRCSQSCPTGALKALKISDDEMNEIVKNDGLEVLRPEFDTKPRIYYKNLHRFDKCFIGGSVVAQLCGVEECISGAIVILSHEDKEVERLVTDDFGDFKFDNITPGSGNYVIEIQHSDFGKARLIGEVYEESLYLGDVCLS